MITLREQVNSLPSAALTAMMDGLMEQLGKDDFQIDMATFGEIENDVCFGCAATCASLKLRWDPEEQSKADFVNNRYGQHTSEAYTAAKLDMLYFESAIDVARRGDAHELFVYCGIDVGNVDEELFRTPKLGSYDVKLKEPWWREYIKMLEEAGY